MTPGTLVTAFAQFEARLATSASWPLTLGGATVTVVDASGGALPAEISYASPKQINYRIPAAAATGLATVGITAGGVRVPSALNIVPVYLGLFKQNVENLAAAQVATLIPYGTGLNGAGLVTATIGGMEVAVAYAGPQGTFAGLDQINIPATGAVDGTRQGGRGNDGGAKAVEYDLFDLAVEPARGAAGSGGRGLRSRLARRGV